MAQLELQWDCIVPRPVFYARASSQGWSSFWGRLHCAIEQGYNSAAAEVLPVPAQSMVAVLQAQEQQAGSLALVMVLLPCCSIQAEPLPFLVLGLLLGFHHKELGRGGGFQGRMGQTGAVQG